MGTLCFDLDGTLCTNTGGAYETAQPLAWSIARLNALAAAGHRVIVLTARGSATGIDWRVTTEAQLERWGVRYDALHFGKPSADVYVDDRAVALDAWRAADAFAAPGFAGAAADTELPSVPSPPLSAVVELGRTWRGAPLRLAAHAARAAALAAAAGIAEAPEAQAVARAVTAALDRQADRTGEDVVYAICVGETAHQAHPTWWPAARPRVEVALRPLAEVVAGHAGWWAGPGRAVLGGEDGDPRGWPVVRRGGRVRDGLGGQLVVIRDDDVVIAPAAGPPTVIATWVGELAGRLGLAVREADISYGDLARADETLVLGMPLGVVCLVATAADQPGPVGLALQGALHRRTSGPAAARAVAAVGAT